MSSYSRFSIPVIAEGDASPEGTFWDDDGRPAVAADAWGAFSTSSARASFNRACKAVKVSHLKLRPYDLRHSYGTAVYLATGNLDVARELLGHTTTAMTRRYTLAAVPPQVQAAVDHLERFSAQQSAGKVGRSGKS